MNRTDVLIDKINSLGLRGGCDCGNGDILIIANEWELLGRVKEGRQYHVELYKQFDRKVTGDTKKAVYEAINVFVNTPMEEKESAE